MKLTKRQLQVLREVGGIEKISANSYYKRRHIILRHLKVKGLIEYDNSVNDGWKMTINGDQLIRKLYPEGQ